MAARELHKLTPNKSQLLAKRGMANGAPGFGGGLGSAIAMSLWSSAGVGCAVVVAPPDRCGRRALRVPVRAVAPHSRRGGHGHISALQGPSLVHQCVVTTFTVHHSRGSLVPPPGVAQTWADLAAEFAGLRPKSAEIGPVAVEPEASVAKVGPDSAQSRQMPDKL